MSRRFRVQPRRSVVLLASMILALSATILFAGGSWSGSGPLARAVHPQLISVQPLPETDGDMCPLAPVSAGSSLFAAFQRADAGRGAVPSEALRTAAARRPPLRMIHDPYSAYSAVAVDPVRDEVVLSDENLFSILVYDRLENTPPRAKMSEPKRILKGEKTEIELTCAVYVDPANGDIYSVTADTAEKLLIFPREARGNVAAARALQTPHSTFGIAVDEKNQEMLLTVQNDAAVITYRKTAKDQDPVLRVLQGERTQLADPHGIAYDAKNDLIYVANWGTVAVHKAPESGPAVQTPSWSKVARTDWPVGLKYAVPGTGKFLPPSITVYPRNASGDMAPLRVIRGSKAQLNWPTAVAIDPEHGELYVANDPTHSIVVFKADADGDAAPVRVLQGPKTLIQNPTGIYLDLKNDELWVANYGNHRATVYKRTASGDTAPLRVIRSAPEEVPAPMFGNPAGLAYDSKREEILVAS